MSEISFYFDSLPQFMLTNLLRDFGLAPWKKVRVSNKSKDLPADWMISTDNTKNKYILMQNNVTN